MFTTIGDTNMYIHSKLRINEAKQNQNQNEQ